MLASGLTTALASALPATAASTGLPHFAPQWGAWAVVAVVAGVYVVGALRSSTPPNRRQVGAFIGAMAVSVVALSWPLAPMAEHRLLVALVVQRLILLLALPPLLLCAIPGGAVAAATRPAALDAIAQALSRPIPAVALVTVVCVGTLSVPAVQAQSSSPVVRGGLDFALAVAGLVLWLPLQHPVPATRGLSALGRAGYLVVQSIVPSFLCIVWIFARHPLYPAYARTPGLLGLSALSDQQLSGFVAKLATIGVLWTVALFTILHADTVTDAGGDPEPLVWADVERQIERADRRERTGRPPRLEPPPSAISGTAGPIGSPVAGRSPTGRVNGPDPLATVQPGAGLAPGWALMPSPAGRRARSRPRRTRGSPDGGAGAGGGG